MKIEALFGNLSVNRSEVPSRGSPRASTDTLELTTKSKATSTKQKAFV